MTEQFPDWLEKQLELRIHGFMDGVDWEWHLGETNAMIYPTEEMAGHGHDTTECGMVEVEVRLIRWVKKPTRKTPNCT